MASRCYHHSGDFHSIIFSSHEYVWVRRDRFYDILLILIYAPFKFQDIQQYSDDQYDLWNGFVDLSFKVIEHSNNFLHRMWIRLNDIYVHVYACNILCRVLLRSILIPTRNSPPVHWILIHYPQLNSPEIKIHFVFNLSGWASHAYKRRFSLLRYSYSHPFIRFISVPVNLFVACVYHTIHGLKHFYLVLLSFHSISLYALESSIHYPI